MVRRGRPLQVGVAVAGAHGGVAVDGVQVDVAGGSGSCRRIDLIVLRSFSVLGVSVGKHSLFIPDGKAK